MPHLETVKSMFRTKTGAWVAGAMLLCSLIPQMLSGAQQLPAQANAASQRLNQPAPAATQAQTVSQPVSQPVTQTPPKIPVSASRPAVPRRDPFSPLVGGPDRTGGSPERLPPGKAGLVVATLRIDGIVRGP